VSNPRKPGIHVAWTTITYRSVALLVLGFAAIGRVARPSVLFFLPNTELWVPRPCAFGKGGHDAVDRMRCYTQRSASLPNAHRLHFVTYSCCRKSHSASSPVPALRKLREGRGTPILGSSAENHRPGHPPKAGHADLKRGGRGRAAGVRGSRLVLHRHGLGIDGLLASDALQSGQDSSILVLVALHGETALLVAIRPSQADVMFL